VWSPVIPTFVNSISKPTFLSQQPGSFPLKDSKILGSVGSDPA